jgi:uncharacterized repeat protein (TIGR01451 family)
MNTAYAYGGGDPNHTSTNPASGSDTAMTQAPAAPTFTKSFGSSSINQGDTIPVTFTISNSNPIPLTGLAFTDTLPSGLQIQNPNGLTNTCGAPGTASAPAGTGTISMSGGTVAAMSSCTVTVNITGIVPGDQTNPSVTLTSTEAGPAVSAPATVFVYPWWLWFFY